MEKAGWGGGKSRDNGIGHDIGLIIGNSIGRIRGGFRLWARGRPMYHNTELMCPPKFALRPRRKNETCRNVWVLGRRNGPWALVGLAPSPKFGTYPGRVNQHNVARATAAIGSRHVGNRYSGA